MGIMIYSLPYIRTLNYENYGIYLIMGHDKDLYHPPYEHLRTYWPCFERSSRPGLDRRSAFLLSGLIGS